MGNYQASTAKTQYERAGNNTKLVGEGAPPTHRSRSRLRVGCFLTVSPFAAVRHFMSNLTVAEHEVKLLDLGCGVGSLSFAVAAAFPHVKVTGIDPCMSLAQQAEERRRKTDGEVKTRLAFAVGSPIKLPFKPGTFDLVIGCSNFHFWDTQSEKVPSAPNSGASPFGTS